MARRATRRELYVLLASVMEQRRSLRHMKCQKLTSVHAHDGAEQQTGERALGHAAEMPCLGTGHAAAELRNNNELSQC